MQKVRLSYAYDLVNGLLTFNLHHYIPKKVLTDVHTMIYRKFKIWCTFNVPSQYETLNVYTSFISLSYITQYKYYSNLGL